MSNCIQRALSQLNDDIRTEVLVSLRATCVAAKDALNALKIKQQAQLLALEITLVPLQATRSVLETTISTMRGSTHIVPNDLILECPQLGQINATIEKALSTPIEKANAAAFDMDRLISKKLIIQAEISSIDTKITSLDEVIISIDTILAS